MKKFNWGTGITIVIVLFLLVTVGQVLLIHYYVDYDLVEEEYYDAEIKYQTQIEKIRRTNELAEQLVVRLLNDSIEFNFPQMFSSSSIEGNIKFYKPSDDLLDKNYKIDLSDENKMFFPIKDFARGLWKIKVDWNVEGITYFNEEFLMVP